MWKKALGGREGGGDHVIRRIVKRIAMRGSGGKTKRCNK